MVWRRITNESRRRGESKGYSESQKQDKEAESSLTCEMLEEYLRELVLDLNLHLLWEWEGDNLLPQKKLMWVDGITVTGYENIHGSEKANQSRKGICSSRKNLCPSTQTHQQRLLRKIRDCLLVLWRIGQLPYP